MKRLSSCIYLFCGLGMSCGSPVDPITGDNLSGLSDGGARADGATGVGSDGGVPGYPGSGYDAGVVGVPVPDDMGRCEIVDIDTGPVIPDMLIVLDRSGSMKQENLNIDCRNGVDWLNPVTYACIGTDCADPANANSALCGGTQVINRWDPSVAALKTVTSTLSDRVSFGLMLFPDPNAGGRNGSCAAGRVVVDEGLNNAQSIAQALDNTAPGGATPTGATLEAALARIQQKTGDIDSTFPPQYILLVTDGQPTCPNGNGSGGGQAQDADRALTTQAITNLTNAGVTTYVLGYDAQLDNRFEGALNEFAQAGGTDHYRPVADQQSLVTEIESITKRVASCSYRLANKPADPKYVLVTLDGKQLNLNDADGWMINERDVLVTGSACATLQDGTVHGLNVTVQCEPVVLK